MFTEDRHTLRKSADVSIMSIKERNLINTVHHSAHRDGGLAIVRTLGKVLRGEKVATSF